MNAVRVDFSPMANGINSDDTVLNECSTFRLEETLMYNTFGMKYLDFAFSWRGWLQLPTHIQLRIFGGCYSLTANMLLCGLFFLENKSFT